MAAQVGATDLFGPIGANTPGLAVARSASRVVADSGHDQHTVFLRRSRLSPLEQQVLPSARTVGRTEIDSHGGACYFPFVHLPTGGTVMIPALIDPSRVSVASWVASIRTLCLCTTLSRLEWTLLHLVHLAGSFRCGALSWSACALTVRRRITRARLRPRQLTPFVALTSTSTVMMMQKCPQSRRKCWRNDLHFRRLHWRVSARPLGVLSFTT